MRPKFFPGFRSGKRAAAALLGPILGVAGLGLTPIPAKAEPPFHYEYLKAEKCVLSRVEETDPVLRRCVSKLVTSTGVQDCFGSGRSLALGPDGVPICWGPRGSSPARRTSLSFSGADLLTFENCTVRSQGLTLSRGKLVCAPLPDQVKMAFASNTVRAPIGPLTGSDTGPTFPAPEQARAAGIQPGGCILRPGTPCSPGGTAGPAAPSPTQAVVAGPGGGCIPQPGGKPCPLGGDQPAEPSQALKGTTAVVALLALRNGKVVGEVTSQVCRDRGGKLIPFNGTDQCHLPAEDANTAMGQVSTTR